MNQSKITNCYINNKKIEFSTEIHHCIEVNSKKLFRIYPDDESLDSYPQDQCP